MSPHDTARLPYARGFPRVSGDEPMPRAGFESEVEFSPRERG